MELVRTILVNVAESRSGLDVGDFVGEEWGSDEVAYHFRLLEQAGLLVVEEFGRLAKELTWDGHEAMAVVSDPEVWGRVKLELGKRTRHPSFEMMRSLANRYALGE